MTELIVAVTAIEHTEGALGDAQASGLESEHLDAAGLNLRAALRTAKPWRDSTANLSAPAGDPRTHRLCPLRAQQIRKENPA